MNECRKYESVLIGTDHDSFLAQLEKAARLQEDGAYLALLDKEAKENDWSAKAQAIIDLIGKYE
jgi:hypothetical protein